MLKSSDPNNTEDLVSIFNEWAENTFVWPAGHEPQMTSFFEHGQWWVQDINSDATWSVVDAEGGDAVAGYSFEQITDGELA